MSSSSALANVTFIRVIRIIKLARVLRIVRVFRVFRELRLLILSITASMGSMCWVLVLLFTTIFMFAVFFAIVISDHLAEGYVRTEGIEHYYSSLYWTMV